MAKLAVISAISRSNAMMIGPDDVERAFRWLVEAEATMPLIFRNMTSGGDEAILGEVLYEMRSLYKHGIPLDPRTVFGLFASRAKAHQVHPLMAMARNRGDFEVVNGLIVPN